jgi:SPP1 gp7 family putative phage head morphogenesis protein
MPDFQYIPDSPIEIGLEKARQAATRLDEKYADRLAEELAKLGRKVLPADADPLEIGVDGMIGRAMDNRKALDDLLEKMMLEAAVLGAKEGDSSLSQLLRSTKAVIHINSAWDLANLTVEQWIRTQHWFSPLSLTQGLSSTEQNRIRTLIVDYVTNQRPQAWLRDRIIGDTGLYGRQRAETIARTEVTHAFARGNRAAWAGRGVERVSWRTRVDELVCPICGPLHLQEFDVDSDVIPPAHARCRCWIVPAVDMASLNNAVEEGTDPRPRVDTSDLPLARGASWSSINSPKARADAIAAASEDGEDLMEDWISRQHLDRLHGLANDPSMLTQESETVFFGLDSKRLAGLGPGDTFSALGTRSTTSDIRRAIQYAGAEDGAAVFEVLIPKGVVAIRSTVLGVDETVLLPGAKFRIAEITAQGVRKLELIDDGKAYINELHDFREQLDEILKRRRASSLER